MINQNKEYPALWFREISTRLKADQDEALEIVRNGGEKREPLRVPCCKLEKVIDCDADYIPGYRNKVEFTIGREYAGVGKVGPLIVGFSQGNVSKGIMYTGRAGDTVILSAEARAVAASVE